MSLVSFLSLSLSPPQIKLSECRKFNQVNRKGYSFHSILSEILCSGRERERSVAKAHICVFSYTSWQVVRYWVYVYIYRFQYCLPGFLVHNLDAGFRKVITGAANDYLFLSLSFSSSSSSSSSCYFPAIFNRTLPTSSLCCLTIDVFPDVNSKS